MAVSSSSQSWDLGSGRWELALAMAPGSGGSVQEDSVVVQGWECWLNVISRGSVVSRIYVLRTPYSVK